VRAAQSAGKESGKRPVCAFHQHTQERATKPFLAVAEPLPPKDGDRWAVETLLILCSLLRVRVRLRSMTTYILVRSHLHSDSMKLPLDFYPP
jgi:hypothetical protein